MAAAYRVFPINPMSVARYRDRHGTSAKSDAGHAHVLAEIVRLDHAHHRQLTAVSTLRSSPGLTVERTPRGPCGSNRLCQSAAAGRLR